MKRQACLWRKAKACCCWMLLTLLAWGCDEAADGLDHFLDGAEMYEFTTRSVLVDSLYAQGGATCLLGQYADEQMGEFNAGFLAQFACPDDFGFDENIIAVKSVKLQLFYSTFFGDSLNAMRLQVDTLDRVFPAKGQSPLYTDLDPADFYNEKTKPLAVKALSALGPSVDSIYTDNDSEERLIRQTIKLPNQLGDYLLKKYREDPASYQNAATFANRVLKGVYVHCTHGDGTMLYIHEIRLAYEYDALVESSSGKRDSLATLSGYFAADKHVVRSHRFRNPEMLQELAAGGDCSYLKTPAGIFTEAAFPLADIQAAHPNDSLAAVQVSFTSYNERNSKYKMDAPPYLLMVRKKDMYAFFEQQQMADNQTSFLAAATDNTYTFSDIAPLVRHCLEEREQGLATRADWETENSDWNKVMLIPVSCTTDDAGQITEVFHASGMESAKLKGGGKDKLKMQVFPTAF